MEITEVCIRRPVFATVLTLIVIVLGLVCQSRLSVRQYPQIERSLISVESEFQGASPKAVEAQITKLLEGQFATIPGVELITSTSTNEKSNIYIEFAPDRNSDGAASDVRDRLSLIRNQLPRNIPEPIIRKDSSDSGYGIVVSITSKRHSIDDLRDYVDRYVKSKFEVLPGVGRVMLFGGNIKSLRIYLDPQKLAAYGYTPADIVEAIPTQHSQRPCGRLISKDKEYMLVVNGELSRPEEFDEIVLPSNGTEKVVRIKDVGKSKLVAEDVRSGAWFNGRECVQLAISKQSTANPVELSKAVREIMPQVNEYLPTGATAVLSRDEADDINASMSNVYRAIFESIFLVVLVVFLFLWSFNATIIPIVTIPVSLIGTFALLYLFDFSINTFTLLAMVLAVGLVVDDAIVVLENVHRHMEKGLSRFQAAIVGSKEIYFSVIAMTLTLATAYIPIAMTPGTIGKLFREFALTLSGAVLISGFIAVTLSPMMCSKFLEPLQNAKGKAVGFFQRAHIYQRMIITRLERKYLSYLDFALRNRRFVVYVGGIFAIIGIILIKTIPSENMPAEDTGYISIMGNAPIGATYEFMKENGKIVDAIMANAPFVKNRTVVVGTDKIDASIELQRWEDRNLSAKEIADILTPQLRQVSGVPCSATAGVSESDKEIVDFVLQTNQSYEYLEKEGHKFLWDLQSNYPGIKAPIQSQLVPPQEEYVVDINRDRAASLNVSVDDIVSTIGYFVNGQKAANVQREAKRDELFVQLESDLRRNIDDLYRMLVKSRRYTGDNEARMIPLRDLITVRERQSPTGLNHYNQMVAARVWADVASGYTVGQVVDDINEIKASQLPDTIQLTFAGTTKTYLEDSRQITMVFLLALVFVFLILAAQFESFIDPFIIMLSVPFSITGALIALFIFPAGTLNVYSKVGLVTLIGLITKHGILIVDFANKLMADGKNVIRAVRQAAYMRLRPILMTTFAMVIGTIPLALARGAGAAARQQIGWAIVGGMSFGTLFTLFIVPVVYVIFSTFKGKLFADEE